ncbi:MAG: hypothetical protein WCD70_03855 [Alphaproteobacteria bacterium]
MPDSTKELLELILTQSIERYVEMKPADAEKAIAQEWPQQIRTLLRVFLHKTTCDKCQTSVRFMVLMKKDGNGVYVSPVCNCKSRIPFNLS